MKIWIFWLLFWGIVLSGCRTAQERVDRMFNKHPELAVKECNERWPTKAIDSATVIDSIRRAYNVNWAHYIDSLQKVAQNGSNEVVLPDSGAYRDCKKEYDALRGRFTSVSDALGKLRSQYKPCNPDTMYVRTTVRILDMKPVQILRDSLKEVNVKLIKAEEKRDNRTTQRNWLVVALLIAVGLLLLKIRGFF